MAKKTKSRQPAQEIEDSVVEYVSLAYDLAAREQELMQADERFKEFIEMQQSFKEQSQDIFDRVETKMIEHDVKSLKGEWGTISLVERTYFKVDEDELPKEYMKSVPDLKKIGDEYKLTGEAVDGTTHEVKQHLQKRFK